jgi:1-acyl-sn-glycerol-3-phosphate acyltransferase
MPDTREERPPAAAPGAAAELLAVVEALARETRPGWRGTVSLDSALEGELGLDSLGRAELLQRVERTFGVALSERVLASAESPRDLLRALAEAAKTAETEAGSAGASRFAAGLASLPPAEAAPDRTRTLLEVLDWHAGRHPERRHVLFYPPEGPAEELTYGDLARRACALALGLRERGLAPGQAVGLMLPTSLDFFTSFLGIELAGGVPVPLYPPARRSQIEDHLRRQAGILATSRAALLVTSPEVLPLARLLRAQLPALARVATPGELAAGPAASALLPGSAGDAVAFLQFTSGSTGNPKGVVLTHANLLANLRAIGQALAIGPDEGVVSWLPLYHDMGLIGAWMGSFYYGLPLALLSPLSFLARPSRWLWAIDRHRATLSAAPNFAYELCLRKIADEEIEGLDLSSWRVALNGAEAVSPATVDAFAGRFARHGFRPGALAPVYGLAECSLALAFPPPGRPPAIDAVQREPLARTGRAVPAAPGDPHALRFVSCGLPLPGHEVRIVDAAGSELPERHEGRLEFRGPSATAGYFGNPEATRRLLRDGWLDSGDTAYIAGGEIHVTGRVKDIIIRAGRNLYPEEIEGAVGEVAGVRRGCVAVFGSPDPASGTERLVVLAETYETEEGARERLRQAISEVTVDLLGAPADEVVLAPPHTVPKTSSGKIRRAAARELYEGGGVSRRRAPPAWQLARLAWSAARPEIRRAASAALALLYAGWAWLVFGLAALPVWSGVALLPGLRRRRAFARGAGCLLARLAGDTLVLTGAEHLATGGPRIVVANHASYLDVYVLSSLLPPEFAFVAKRELLANLFARVFLERLGTVFVERFDPALGAGEAQKALEAVEAGESLVVFAEGTFGRAPGLTPFRMGAFVVATEAGVPIVPVALRGTRSLLRDVDWFPRRGRVEVTVLPPLYAKGHGWAAAVGLRDAVRAAILAHCGEPDLAPALS